MNNRMSLSEARMIAAKHTGYSPVKSVRAARAIVAVGEVLDKIREECPRMTREQYVSAAFVDREVNNTVHEILGRLEDALGEDA